MEEGHAKLTLRQRRRRVNELLRKQAEGLGEINRRQLEGLKHTDLIAFSSLVSRHFVELVRRLIDSNDGNGIQLAMLEDEAAGQLGISTETVKRYRRAHCWSRGEFMVFGKLVLLNPNYQAPSEEDEDTEGSEE